MCLNDAYIIWKCLTINKYIFVQKANLHSVTEMYDELYL